MSDSSVPQAVQIEAPPANPDDPTKWDDLKWSVERLLRFPESENSWIIKPLIRPGSQMLLAAPPKTGKSLLASEIALALALPFKEDEKRYLFGALPHKPSDFPGLEILPPPTKSPTEPWSWRVLFLSLEMRETEVSIRLRQQLGKFQLPTKIDGAEVPKELIFPLTHVFGLADPKSNDPVQDLSIVETEEAAYGQPPKVKDGTHFNELRSLIKHVKPDVIIFDTLIQLHSLNENDNILMKGVMRALRKIAVVEKEDANHKIRNEPVAHIVVHHTRKESNQYRAPLSPEIMRGAGAVHGVADLVMLARKDYRPGTLEVHVSSRTSDIPNFYLKRNQSSLTHEWVEIKNEEKISNPERVKLAIVSCLKDAGQNGRRLDWATLHTAISDEAQKSGQKLKADAKTIQRHFDALRDEKRLHIVSAEEELTKDGKERKNQKHKWHQCWFGAGPGDGTKIKSIKPDLAISSTTSISDAHAHHPRKKKKKNPRPL